MADIGDGAVAVIGHRLHHDRHAPRTVPFVGHLFVVGPFEIAGGFVDGALNVVHRHRNGPCPLDRQAQGGVGFGIAASGFGRHGDITHRFGEEFALFGILFGFDMFDFRPFVMTCHCTLQIEKIWLNYIRSTV